MPAERWHPWLIAALALVVRLVWVAVAGPRVTNDGRIYFAAADDLLANGPATLEGMALYTGTVLYAATLRLLFGAHAAHAWVLIQSCVVALATVPLYHFSRAVFDTRVARLAALAHALLFESFQWEAYALSDSLFQAMVIATLEAIRRSEGLAGPSARRWRRVRNAAFVALTLWRPVGFLVAAAYLAWKAGAARPRAWTRRQRVVAAGLVLVAAAFVVVQADALQASGGTFAREAATGQIINDDPWAVVSYGPDPYDGGLVAFFLANPLGYLGVAALRFVAFFAFILPRYSPPHVALNLLTVAPLVLIGLAMAARTLARPGLPRLLSVLVLAFAAFHAFTLLDYDLRYRDPVLPALEILAAAGLVAMVDDRRPPAKDGSPAEGSLTAAEPGPPEAVPKGD